MKTVIMKTNLILFASLVVLLLGGCSKKRETPPPGPKYEVYLFGRIDNGGKGQYCYWKDGEFFELTASGIDGVVPRGLAVADDGTVYVSGFDYSQTIGYWKNGVWNAIELPYNAQLCYVSSITACDGSVFLTANYRDSENKVSQTSVWRDTYWNQLNVPSDTHAFTASLTVCDGSIYISGYGIYGRKIGYWKDQSWTSLPSPTGADKAYPEKILCSGGSVYLAGEWADEDIDRDHRVCYWKDGNVTVLRAPGNAPGECFGLAVSDGTVYVLGSYQPAPLQRKACYWKDGVFHDLDLDGTANAMSVCDGSMYAAGRYYTSPDSYSACYWKDGERIDLPCPIEGNSQAEGIVVVKR